ncbi:MAG: crossover junction endodeoxyribonuclease RuvC [Candidatus Omnitrophota bacterium]|jgi:crossover junction endodeoxyribonuclease RuvC|nr:MAG: crossover junction endodeoxyribonuclease RuvC [Candidatus Omnitrophota bacterium]
MVILGIDPALTITGYGAVDYRRNGLLLIEAGIIKTSSKDSLAYRLSRLYKAVSGLISDIKPQVVVLEKLYVHYRHPATAYILGQARGVICLACAVKNVTLVEYAATRVKKAIVGKGLASKQQIQKMIISTLRLSKVPKYMDVTDALALAIAHGNIIRTKL